jgi:hypothetical protein
MAPSIFFPYYYLSNDTLLRHQYLYAPTLLRVLPSDRPPRDSKHLKRIISELSQFNFLDNASQVEFDLDVNQRFMHLVEYGFDKNNPNYVHCLGKYEKELASAKTFHLCRNKVWQELVERLVELRIAEVDRYGEWCFSTRKMVISFNTCLTISQQEKQGMPRCTDSIEHEELATLIECSPCDNDDDVLIQRAILEFPYYVPKNLAAMQLERMQTIRESLADDAKSFQNLITENSLEIQKSESKADFSDRIRHFHNQLHEINGRIYKKLQSHNEQIAIQYAQYRWYIPQDSCLSEIQLDDPVSVKDVSCSIINAPVVPNNAERILSYPGAYIWVQESPSLVVKTGGIFKRLFSFGK